jgi:hypothetical protein
MRSIVYASRPPAPGRDAGRTGPTPDLPPPRPPAGDPHAHRWALRANRRELEEACARHGLPVAGRTDDQLRAMIATYLRQLPPAPPHPPDPDDP